MAVNAVWTNCAGPEPPALATSTAIPSGAAMNAPATCRLSIAVLARASFA